MEYLVGEVRVQGTGDVGDLLGLTVDEPDKPLQVFPGPRNIERAGWVAEVHLHIDYEQMNSGLVGTCPGKIGAGCPSTDGLHIRIEDGSDSCFLTVPGRVLHGFLRTTLLIYSVSQR
jgi:hypothetical protein